MLRIMVVDDDAPMTRILEDIWSEHFDAEVVAAHSAEDALRMLDKRKADVIVSDYGLQGMNGLDLLRGVKDRVPTRILMTGRDDPELLRAARQAGIDHCGRKSGRLDDWIAILDKVLTRDAS